MTQPPWPPSPPPTNPESPGWQGAPLPPGLPPGYVPSDAGGGGQWREGGPLPAWEDRSLGGIVRRFGLTVQEVVLRPGALFERAGNSEEIGAPLLFAVVISTAARLLQSTTEWLMGSRYTELIIHAVEAAVTGKAPPTLGPAGATSVGAGWLFGLAAATPVTASISLLVTSAVIHVILMIAGGAHRGYAVSVRVFCYASVAQIASVVPGFGPIVAGLWAMVLHIIGLSRAHRTDAGRAAAAVLSPTVCGLLCGIAAVAVLGAAIFAAIRSALP